MDEPLLTESTPTEYFKNLVESAITQANVPATERTNFYLVHLLCLFVSPDRKVPYSEYTREPLACQFSKALQCVGIERRHRLRSLADYTLFVSGFYPLSLQKSNEVNYLIYMGRSAYFQLADNPEDVFGDVFPSLAVHFTSYMNVLKDVSRKASLKVSPMLLLELYDRWCRTGDAHLEEDLVERGIMPNRSIRNKRLQ